MFPVLAVRTGGLSGCVNAYHWAYFFRIKICRFFHKSKRLFEQKYDWDILIRLRVFLYTNVWLWRMRSKAILMKL